VAAPRPGASAVGEVPAELASGRKLGARRTSEALNLLERLPNVRPAPIERAKETFARWEEEEEEEAVISSTEGRIGRFPIYDILSLPTWHRGPVCLIGDAAHATSSHAGQSASTALEDAIVLARCLRDLPDAEGAFAAFELLRKGRVKRIVAGARRTGNQKVPSNAFTRGLRDLVLPFFLKMGIKDAARIHSHRVDWDEKVA
jgi:FAD-dependent urate hydroxylase